MPMRKVQEYIRDISIKYQRKDTMVIPEYGIVQPIHRNIVYRFHRIYSSLVCKQGRRTKRNKRRWSWEIVSIFFGYVVL